MSVGKVICDSHIDCLRCHDQRMSLKVAEVFDLAQDIFGVAKSNRAVVLIEMRFNHVLERTFFYLKAPFGYQ